MEKKGFQEGFCARFKIENFVNSAVNNPPAPSDPNEAMRFDNKSDEDIVYRSGYKPLRPVEQLIRNDEDSKPAQRKKKKGRIPRRLNMFIIYRRDKSILPRFKGLRAYVVTEEISKMWEAEPLEVKEYFAALARMAEKIHKKTYGEDYKYRPGPYRKPKKNEKSKKERKENSLDKPNTVTKQQQLLTPETSPAVLTPQTSNSSPVLEQPLLVESIFPQLSAIYPLPQGLPPPESQQQYLLTPESNSDSPVSSSLEPELNFAELAMFPPLDTVVPEEFGQQATTSSQENNSCTQYNNDAINLQQQGINISSLSTELLQVLASSLENNQCMQYNDDSIDNILQQGVDNSLLPTNYLSDETKFNNNCYDFPLFDDAEQQPYDNSYDNSQIYQMDVQQNEQQQAMMLMSEYFNTTKCNDNPFFDINLPVQQQQYDNSIQTYQTNFLEKSFDNDTTEQQHEQDFEYFFNFPQWNTDLSNIATFDSSLFKKSE